MSNPRFGKYGIVTLLGRGGLAEVYKAKVVEGPACDQTVALKRLTPRLASDREAVDLFCGEADVSAMLKHPNIVEVFEAGVQTPMMVMNSSIQYLHNHERELYLLDKALMKSITIMKSTLVGFDDIINSVHYNWILKELLMQYRLIIHGDIDTFLKLRKRLKVKMPPNYLSSNNIEKILIDKSTDDESEETAKSIHLGNAFLS